MQMIPMITKEKLVQTIRTNKALFRETIEAIIYYLELPTPSLNPMKIDEERMATCFEEVFTKDIYAKSNFKTIVDKYNSTIEDHQVLQPLPSEMPKEFKSLFGTLDKAIQIWRWFTKHYGTPKSELQPLPENPPDWFNKMFNWASPEDSRKIWSEIINHYGTPTKKELPSVEELGKEIAYIHVPFWDERKLSRLIAQHIIDTYSLNPTKRDEFPFNLKKGDKFMGGGREFILEKLETTPRLYTRTGYFEATDCTPYIEQSIHDKFMASLSEESKKLYEQLKEATK